MKNNNESCASESVTEATTNELDASGISDAQLD